MTPLELPYHLPRLQVPDLHSPIVTPAHESTAVGIERQRPNQHVMADECPDAFASICIPNLHLTVVGARNDQIILEALM